MRKYRFIALIFLSLLMLAMPASAQTSGDAQPEQSHASFNQKARDASILAALQDHDPYARQFQPRTSDPASPSNGAVWYRSDTDVVKVKLNSGVVTLTGTGGSPGGSNGQIQYNNNGAFGGLASVPVSSGGTGQTTYTNGQLLIGNTTGNTLTKATLTAGSNVTITNGGGSITIAAIVGGVGGWTDSTTRTVAASVTQYNYIFPSSTAFNSVESNRQSVVPDAFTLSRMYIRTSTSQPADGALTCAVRVNGVTDTSLSVTVAANAAPGIFTDTTHTASVNAGDLLSLKCVNASASSSAGIFDFRFVMVKN